MTVTVCIPAYRAGRFLAETLGSVVDQTVADLRIEVGIDPDTSDGTGAPEDSLAALAPFLSDARIRVHSNPARLGWDGNIRALVERVATPYYAILPHDDVWDPRYVEILLGALEPRAAGSVAYGDLYTFGSADPWRHAVPLPRDAGVRAQLLSFLIQGAEAMPWRGITRTALRPPGGFPADGHRGFGVECEYALALILAGPAIHLPQTLYYKRIHAAGVMSASRARLVEPGRIELEQAWRNYAGRMHGLLERGLASMGTANPGDSCGDPWIWAAFTAAMLRCCPAGVPLPAEEVDRARRFLEDLPAAAAGATNPVASRLHLALARHATERGDRDAAAAHAEDACAADPANWEASRALATDLEARGRLIEALDRVAQSERAWPGGAGLAALRRRIYGRLGWSAPAA